MSASLSSVVTQGYGPPGSINLVVTLGYGLSGTPTPTTASLSGTAILSISASDIVDGGKTLIITLANDSWVVATFNAQRQAILNGIVSAQNEALGFNALRPSIPVTAVVRTSPTIVTITLPALPTYVITVPETLTVTVPASALSISLIAVVASPSFTISPAGQSRGGMAYWWGGDDEEERRKRRLREAREAIGLVLPAEPVSPVAKALDEAYVSEPPKLFVRSPSTSIAPVDFGPLTARLAQDIARTIPRKRQGEIARAQQAEREEELIVNIILRELEDE